MECHFIGSVNTFSVSASSSSLSYSHSSATWACLAHDEISSQTIDRSSFLQIVVYSKVKQVLRSSSAAMYSSVVVSGSICWMSSSRLVARASFCKWIFLDSIASVVFFFFWSNLWCYFFSYFHDPSYGCEDVHWLQDCWCIEVSCIDLSQCMLHQKLVIMGLKVLLYQIISASRGCSDDVVFFGKKMILMSENISFNAE